MVNQHKLIEDNIRLVYHVVHRKFPRYATDEDLIQVGMIGLCNAAEAWDESKGTFANFATACIYYAICEEFKRRNKQKATYSLDYQYSNGEDESVTLGDTLVGDLDVDWCDLEGMYASLTEKERIIVDLKRKGLSNNEIVKKLGITKQNVSKHLRQAKLRLEKMNED